MRTGTERTLRIDCDECVMQATRACDDCVVSFIVRRAPGDAIVIDVDEARALRSLAEGGLLPALRHRARRCEPAAEPQGDEAVSGSG
jgi:hypothetical protein